MQQFDCPWCGPRPQIEFNYLRDAQAVPAPGGCDDPRGELERIYLRSNHAGVHEELWQHLHGCRGWLLIRRDNLTHRVDSCRPAAGAGEGAAG